MASAAPIAVGFAALGAQVVACDLLKTELDETAQLASEQNRQLGLVSGQRSGWLDHGSDAGPRRWAVSLMG
jgi:hypothetical protein